MALEKLTTELEENLANPGMRTSQQEGKRRKEQAVPKTTSKKKRLKLDPLTGWGEGEEKQEEMEIQNWLFRTDRVVDNTLDGVRSGQMMKVSRWKPQRLSFTDQTIKSPRRNNKKN